MNATAEQRQRYKDPTGRECDCSRPAVKVGPSGPVCARCAQLEAERAHDVARRAEAARKVQNAKGNGLEKIKESRKRTYAESLLDSGWRHFEEAA